MSSFKKFRNNGGSMKEDVDGDTESYGERNTRKSATTNASMTSSALFRNKQLTLLDDRFDQLLLTEYSDDEAEEAEEDLDYSDDENAKENSKTLLRNTQLNKIFAEFLDTDIKGKRVMERMHPMTSMDLIRKECHLGTNYKSDKAIILQRVAVQDSKKQPDIEFLQEKEDEKWDCETILSTYSNIYNRPKVRISFP